MVIDGLPGGGAEKVVLTLAEGFLRQGHRVSLFSLRKVCEYPIPADVDYQTVIDHCSRPWRKLTETYRRARQLDVAVRQSEALHGKYDLILSNLHKTDRIVRRAKSLDLNKTWYCLHGVFSASYLARKSGFSLWMKQQKIRQTYQGRQLIGVSQYVIDDVMQNIGVKPSKARVIFNPFDFDLISRKAAEPCSLAGNDFILHVGRFHEAKRHDRLLQAYAQSGISAPLVLLGQGNEKKTERLRQQAEDLGISARVRFEGFHANPYPWIRHARLLVVSSDSEGFGNVLVEALSCGTPVVSTRCPGAPAAILSGDLARGLAEMNAESLAQKMREIYTNPPELQKLDLSIYSLNVICQQYLQLVETEEPAYSSPQHIPS
ncbi:glycosyltransferase [Pantoea sp.]|uniref:glycosyltransferase n=1 Tax=Pantoea sp. TaxID=69393 RepID=UPI0031E04E26